MNNNELINKIFSPIFDKKLALLEKNSQSQFNMITTSQNLTSQVVKSCLNISTKVQEKIDMKNRALSALNTSSAKKTNGHRGNLPKNRSKTPIKGVLQYSKSVSKLNSTPGENRKINTSQSLGNLLNNSKIKERTSIRSNTVKAIGSNSKKNNDRAHTINPKTVSNGNSKRPILSLKPSNFPLKLSKNQQQNKNLKTYKKRNPGRISKTIDNESFDKIFSIDETINNDILLSKDDPFLITPLADKEFLEKNKHIIDYSQSFKYKVNKFNVEEWSEDHMVTMIRYYDTQ